MSVVLEEDLVDRCQIGDIVRISGTLRQRWSLLIKNQQPKIELVLHATWISTVNDSSTKDLLPDYAQKLEVKFNDFWRHYADDPIKGRDIILTVVCSDLYQLFLAKLALMLCLIGGVTDISSTGTTVRGDPHLLLIGDAGTGKSCLLKFATRIAKRSVYSTGVGTSSAGLTCSVSKIDGQWHAEPGALPLSNGGVCCIDEFHTLTESDRAALREAMETQRLSVAKAGVKTVLPCRCAVITAMNHESITRVGDAPLYSRFDLILNLSSNASNEMIIDHQMKIAKYIAAKVCTTDASVRTSAKSAPKSFWSVQTLRVYVARVKKLKPVMTPAAESILSQYYAIQRRNAARDDGKTTNRLRDALIRLSQAHARLMYRKTVEICDAIVACILADSSSPGMELFETVDVLHSKFPLEGKKDFITKGTEVLTKLNFQNLISEIIPPYQDLASMLESSTRSSMHVELNAADYLNEKSSVARVYKEGDTLIEKDLLELINSDSMSFDEESPNEYGNISRFVSDNGV